MEPILAALTAEEIAEALGAYVLSKRGIDPASVRTTTELAYNTKSAGIICAVRVSIAAEPAKRGKGAAEGAAVS